MKSIKNESTLRQDEGAVHSGPQATEVGDFLADEENDGGRWGRWCWGIVRAPGDAEWKAKLERSHGGIIIECKYFFEEKEATGGEQQDQKVLEEDAADHGLHARSPWQPEGLLRGSKARRQSLRHDHQELQDVTERQERSRSLRLRYQGKELRQMHLLGLLQQRTAVYCHLRSDSLEGKPYDFQRVLVQTRLAHLQRDTCQPQASSKDQHLHAQILPL